MPNAEEQIRRAIEEGKFDNLAVKGKPLYLEQNSFEDPEWRLANHGLKTSGLSLPWIEKRGEIEALIRSARTSLKRSSEWREQALKDGLAAPFVTAEWNIAVDKFQEQVAEINRLIPTYNLEVPASSLQMSQLSIVR